MDVHVREHPVPGAGRAFEFSLADGSTVSVRIDGANGRRELSRLPHGDDDADADAERACDPGDRLVLAGRPAPLAELRAHLRG